MIVYLVLWFVLSVVLINYQIKRRAAVLRFQERLDKMRADVDAVVAANPEPKKRPELKVLPGGKNNK